MTNDSKLFPPRAWWEERGYRPDEYSRWIKGDWRPITELWAELGVDPAKVQPVDIELEDWLFDTTASPEERRARAQFVHGHLLKPGDVQRTNWRRRCAQPPYDSLPIPRADIPAGITLSRDADAWVREDKTEDIALPLYQGKMIYVDNWNLSSIALDAPASWLSDVEYLIGYKLWDNLAFARERLVFRDIARATDKRTLISTLIPGLPCGNKVPLLSTDSFTAASSLMAQSMMGTFWADWAARRRVAAAHINWHVASSFPILRRSRAIEMCCPTALKLLFGSPLFSSSLIACQAIAKDLHMGLFAHERLRLRCIINSVIAISLGLAFDETKYILRGVDRGLYDKDADPCGFWRVDKDKNPELRQTVLTLLAFHDLEKNISSRGSDSEKGIEAFLNQNDGEGWHIPETLRLADYGLGQDNRAKQSQPVATRLGPRFYDWQLTQRADESWRECHLHARNMLGNAGYEQLLNGSSPGRSSIEQSLDAKKTPDSMTIKAKTGGLPFPESRSKG
jgi:hypothetical protein